MARFALLALLTGAAAFVSKRAPLPARRVAARQPTRAAMVMEDTYWEGEAPPSSRWERFREKYLRRCFGHAPVDLEYIASQSKMEQAKRAAAEEARLKAGG